MVVKGILNFVLLNKELTTNSKKIDLLALSNKILSKVDEDNIDSIYIYGSFINPKYKLIPPKSYFFGLIKYPEQKIQLKPNDLDILVLTKNDYETPTEFKSNIRGKSLIHGDYEVWWVDTDFKDYLHLLIANRNNWEKAVKEKDEMALRINKDIKCIWKNK